MFIKILLACAGLVAVLLVVVALQPATFHVERSITIAAPREGAFAQVNDFHHWKNWSPWEARDPALKRTFSGAADGPGAVYAWSGNRQVGEGRMTIERVEPPARVSIKLEFFKPFAATNTATYSFVPVPGGTRVTWAMDGSNDFVGKAFHLFVDMDRLVGADFERGLARMKSLVEQAPLPSVAVAHVH